MDYILITRSRFSYMASMILILGIIIFLVGLIAEQIAMLRLQHTTHQE
jgi:uncharacterized membrane protein YiaA